MVTLVKRVHQLQCLKGLGARLTLEQIGCFGKHLSDHMLSIIHLSLQPFSLLPHQVLLQ